MLLGEHRHSLDTAQQLSQLNSFRFLPGECAQVAPHVVHHWRVEQHLEGASAQGMFSTVALFKKIFGQPL